MNRKNWFVSWFDSPYYHILYNKRDDEEAKLFLDKLTDFIQPDRNSSILDLACGMGRHAIYLNKKGFEVTGIDLSEKSIHHNKKYENNTLVFFVHDMRNEFRKDSFDYVFNLFTSFGYFDNAQDNIKTLKAIHNNLKAGGLLVLDYINSKQVAENLIEKEQSIMKDILFNIERKIADGYIIKNISFTSKGKDYYFTERVQMLTLQHFQDYFRQTGFEITNLFGDYKLNPFNEATSERLIMMAKKKNYEFVPDSNS
jgi:SAM-dependent methyltransferase